MWESWKPAFLKWNASNPKQRLKIEIAKFSTSLHFPTFNALKCKTAVGIKLVLVPLNKVIPDWEAADIGYRTSKDKSEKRGFGGRRGGGQSIFLWTQRIFNWNIYAAEAV